MEGQYLKINGQWHEITQPELWTTCSSEQEYFKILAERQKRTKGDSAARKREAFIAGKFYFLNHEDTDFFPDSLGVSGKGFEELGF